MGPASIGPVSPPKGGKPNANDVRAGALLADRLGLIAVGYGFGAGWCQTVGTGLTVFQARSPRSWLAHRRGQTTRRTGVPIRSGQSAIPRRPTKALPKLGSRLPKGEKRGRKRMAEIGAVYDITPAARSPPTSWHPTTITRPSRRPSRPASG